MQTKGIDALTKKKKDTFNCKRFDVVNYFVDIFLCSLTNTHIEYTTTSDTKSCLFSAKTKIIYTTASVQYPLATTHTCALIFDLDSSTTLN